jgi:hypothetical protein
MAKERIAPSERIPLPRIDVGNAAPEPGQYFRFAVGHTRNLGRRALLN